MSTIPTSRQATISSAINTAEPLIMHIDLNSCFATVEQQARPKLRGKPVGISNRNMEHTSLVACSNEAKRRGAKVGMKIKEARMLVPDIIVVESDPPKYHFVYQKLMAIMKQYSPHVTMKSIDEGVIDFHKTIHLLPQPSSAEIEELFTHYPHLRHEAQWSQHTLTLMCVGMKIKRQLKEQVGCWMRCNIGIASNRFLAKLSAGFHKPNGLTVICHKNLKARLGELQLTDLPGIAEHYSARLKAAGIFTPLHFLKTPENILRHSVFKSICGRDWHQRLRGYEADSRESTTKTIGRQFVMDERTLNEDVILSRLSLLCESTGAKLRHRSMDARGIYVYAKFVTGDMWYQRKTFKTSFYSNDEICQRAFYLFNQRPKHLKIRELGITCYNLQPSSRNQVSLLEEVNKEEWLTEAIDTVNHQYGSLALTYATSLNSKGVAVQKVPFGSTRYFEMLYQNTPEVKTDYAA